MCPGHLKGVVKFTGASFDVIQRELSDPWVQLHQQ